MTAMKNARKHPVTLASPVMTDAHAAPSLNKADAPTPALVLFGLDQGGKAHAAWFSADDEALARKAAIMMGLHALQASAEPVRAIAATLPQGRVFASGRAFTPFVKLATYQALATAAGLPTMASKPATSRSTARTKAAASDAKPDPTVQEEATVDLPQDWTSIVVGSLVLASEGGNDGWYECIVLEQRGDDLFVASWRDWPDMPTIVRSREHLGLMHPTVVSAP